ncbi:MAG: helix-turn-helix domain-containing protein [Clostridia bacterium]|nr:helix-turn-helix domain-containing protein [Clostridia bacterium]
MTDKSDYSFISKILTDLAANFEQLERDYNLSISFHATNRFFSPFRVQLGKFNDHAIPFCKLIKSSQPLWDKCIRCQRMVVGSLSRNPTPHFGTCCFGVEEFILPIFSEGVAVGFISVTGYTRDREETRRIAQYRLNQAGVELPGLEDPLALLKTTLPDPELLRRLLTPAADLVGFVYIRAKYRPHLTSFSYNGIVSFINANYMSPLSVPIIADYAHYSVSYINHIFKKTSGRSVSAYINEVRVRHAKELLTTTALPIKEIAARVGFDDTNYFASIFKKLTGVTPSGYRHLHMNASAAENKT